jgi:CMP-N-acetylneuraminic acid synthetase/regulator of RNase E activity RraA
MKVVAFLPAKGSSSRIPSKNIKILGGKPLFLHTLDKLINIDEINEVFLDTESQEVISLAGNYRNCNILLRDLNLANNKTDGNSLFFNEVSKVDADIYIQILGTSPFIKRDTIIKGINILKENNDFDSVVLLRKEKKYEWTASGPKYNIENIPNSFELEDSIFETMGLYMVRKEAAISLKRRIGKKPYLLFADATETIDINYPEDFELANQIILGKKAIESKKLKLLKTFLNSAILSDILDELNLNSFIPGLKANKPDHKLFGRVKTLNLKPIAKQDYRGIYTALKTYDFVDFDDIILVNNPVLNNAYFGNLNAHLSVRAGAQGTIVLGHTRDLEDVNKINFPVFSFGTNAQDIKRRGIVDNYNEPILYNNIKIYPEDLVFIDNEGFVILPKSYEKIILSRAIEIISKEKNILASIFSGNDPFSIFENLGEF